MLTEDDVNKATHFATVHYKAADNAEKTEDSNGTLDA